MDAFALLRLDRVDLFFVRLLLGERLHLQAVLVFQLALLDFGRLGRLDLRLLHLAAHLVLTTTLFFSAKASFFFLARATLGVGLGLYVGFGFPLLRVLFVADAVFLDAHQLLQGEEDRRFLLLCHCAVRSVVPGVRHRRALPWVSRALARSPPSDTGDGGDL